MVTWWFCTVTPNDGSSISGIPVSATLPSGEQHLYRVIASVNSIAPLAPLDTDTLTRNWAYTDPDPQSDLSTVEWTMGSTGNTGLGFTLQQRLQRCVTP